MTAAWRDRAQARRSSLSESGFEEIRYTTAEASPTGTWNVNVHVVKDDRTPTASWARLAVRVQEFLPDRLKMTATAV